jgi:hypothetical protein
VRQNATYGAGKGRFSSVLVVNEALVFGAMFNKAGGWHSSKPSDDRTRPLLKNKEATFPVR